VIGSGGMGRVLLAEDEGLAARAALERALADPDEAVCDAARAALAQG